MDRALCLYLLSNFATSNKKISMKTKMIVVVVLAAMCVLPLSAQVKVGVEGGMNLSHYLVSGSDGYKASFRRLEFMLLTDLVLETVLWMLFTKRGII
jgi:hypothetical protein